jgi:hypothetical protein
MSDGPVRYDLLYGRFRWLLSVLGTGPRFSSVMVGPDDVRVRMGWAFRAVVPRSSIVAVRRDDDMRWGIGVHGWKGRWLVNGSTRNIVTVDIDPEGRARVCGIGVRLRRLHLSLVDPDRFVDAVSGGRPI